MRNYVSRYLAAPARAHHDGLRPARAIPPRGRRDGAFKLAIFRDVPGTFNIVGDGVLPLSTVIKLAGRAAVPIPHPIAAPVVSALWVAQFSEAPPGFLDYLQYFCIADGEKAAREMGFQPAYTTREALIDFTSAQRLRDAKLLNESTA